MKNLHISIVLLIVCTLHIPSVFAQPKSNFYVDKIIGYSESGNYFKVSNFSVEDEKTNISEDELKIDEYLISKYSKNNKEIWTKNISLPNFYLNLTEIKFDSKENIYLTGDFFERNSLKIGFYLMKINRSGKVLWSKTFIHTEDLNKNKFSNTIYLTPKRELILLSKAYSESSSAFSQLNVYRFDDKGTIVSEACSQISDRLIGSSIDHLGNVYMLGSKHESNQITIDYLINLADVKKELKNIETNDFLVDELDFDVNIQNVENVQLKEINLFEQKTIQYNNLNLAYSKDPQKVLIKCVFNDNLQSEEVNPNLFSTMEASLSSNLWKDQRNVNISSEITSDFIFNIKNSKVKIENEFSYCKEMPRSLQIMSSETYLIKHIEFQIYKVVQINTNSLVHSEVLEF